MCRIAVSFPLSTLLLLPWALLLSNICADFQIVLLWQLGRHCSQQSFAWLLIMMRAIARTLFEIFIFCPKIQLWFPEKNCRIVLGENSWKCCGFGLLSCWQLWFHEKNCKKNLGEKLVKILGFCQNWIFGQKFDFSNSVQNNH